MLSVRRKALADLLLKYDVPGHWTSICSNMHTRTSDDRIRIVFVHVFMLCLHEITMIVIEEQMK